MRWLINYIRSLFCNHEWELIAKVEKHDPDSRSGLPTSREWTYRCKKCGYVQKVKL